jgi:hypothetical protein
MVVDPILNRNLVGSEQVAQQFPEYRNSVSCTPGTVLNESGVCVPEVAGTTGWSKFLFGAQNVLQVLANVAGSLVNPIVPRTVPNYNVKDRKVLGMDAVTGTVVIVSLSVVAIVGVLGYTIIKKKGIPAPPSA